MGYRYMEITTVLASSMRTTPSQASQHRLQLMQVASVFSKLLCTHTRSRFRRNHSNRVDEIRPGHCKKNLQWMGYSYMEIATVLASSMRTIPSQA